MARSPFDPPFEELPATLPIFPLSGVLLLPQGKLPLNIFEPRYLQMTRDALAGDRLIGMIQPTAPEEPGRPQPLFETGCAGRIVSFAETEDGRYLITLAGLVRFKIRAEIATAGGYRRVEPDFAPFAGDMTEEAPSGAIDRQRLMRALRAYFRQQGISADWESIEKTSDALLVISLGMVCPFQPEEKQALLEAADETERARILTALLEMGLLASGADSARH